MMLGDIDPGMSGQDIVGIPVSATVVGNLVTILVAVWMSVPAFFVMLWLVKDRSPATGELATRLKRREQEFRRPVKCYDSVLQTLEEEQGEAHISFVLERELAKVLKYYSTTQRTVDSSSSEEESSSERADGVRAKARARTGQQKRHGAGYHRSNKRRSPTEHLILPVQWKLEDFSLATGSNVQSG
jgi:hypothetical protein